MINVDVLSEDNNWLKKIKKKKDFFHKVCKAFPTKYQFINKKIFLTLLLSNNKNIKKLNKQFRNKNKSTDILSFPIKRKIKLENNSYLGDIIISFNDAFSINLGLFYRRKKNQKLIGIFHGLSDLSSRVPFFLRKNLVSRLKKSTKNLDFCLFLSEADLVHSRLKYNIQERKSAIFLFGVDKDFWRPINGTKENIDILCVGSDRNRDYEILKEISVKFKIKLLTKIKINLKNNHNIKKISGNFYNSSVSDKDLRHLYNSAKIILIPLRNVFQPSGQSVALQAMACGRTVVITETKGIFDKIVLRNNFNIMFVKPDSIHELNRTISNLLKNESLRNKIGTQARKTILDNFTINHMSKSLEKIINKVS